MFLKIGITYFRLKCLFFAEVTLVNPRPFNDMQAKRANELKIFNLIFGRRTDITFEHEDKPDFWVNTSSGIKFGVEVTELFDTESDARLTKIPNYFNELLDEKQFRHKEDITNIEVVDVTLISPEGKEIGVPAIRYKNSLALESYTQKFCELLEVKNSQITGYSGQLDFHVLLIHDHSRVIHAFKKSEMIQVLFLPIALTKLRESDFSEIYLYRRFKDGKGVIPLKLNIFISYLYWFNDVLVSVDPEFNWNPETYHALFAEFLEIEEFRNVRLHHNDGLDYQVNWGRFNIMISMGDDKVRRINIIDYRELPCRLPVLQREKSQFFSKDVLEMMENEKSKSLCEVDLSFLFPIAEDKD